MNVSELLTNLTQQGVNLWADKDKLKINSPKGILTPQLQADIAARKTEIIAFLRDNNHNSSDTATGLSLQTIGRLIGGYCQRMPMDFKSPIINPQVMAKQLKVTFRPLPKGFKNKEKEIEILKFRGELEQKLQNQGVQICSWQEATREFHYEIPIPLVKWNKSMKMRVVKADVNAVIDVERPINFIGKIKSWIAEKYYQISSHLSGKDKKVSVAKIAQLIGWAEDHAIQRLEDPTSTQVILITELDKNFVDSQLPYEGKIGIGINTLVKTFSEIVIGVSNTHISILNMNLSDSVFPREKFDNFVAKSLIPKIYVPIAPLPISQFEVDKYEPKQSNYAAKLVELSKELATTGLYPSGFKLSEIIKRKSHRDIVDSIVNGRTGVSYGFVAYAEPPQYVGTVEISANQWEDLLSVDGFSNNEVRQNNIGRRYIKTKIKDKYVYKQIPDIWLVCSRSGANKTALNLERDIVRMGLKNQLCLQLPLGMNTNEVDIKPSYDTYVMVAIALATALYTPQLIQEGAPIIHFHGYPSRQWFESHEYYAGVENPSVPCGTYESGVFNFLNIHNIAENNDSKIALASLIEPDHGTNIITSNLEYLLTRLATGIQQQQIELGGKYFASLK
ncbi:MAG: non-ribosomal peptide synthase [Nostocaceae cyanobacterium]|nr:non-ribosomal peptide synthase [Nostocaceae cyanobacterium]